MTASQGFLHAVVNAPGSILGNRQASRVTVIWREIKTVNIESDQHNQHTCREKSI